LLPVPAARGARARAWCRVDLAGGTLDIWPLGLFHPGARTVNVAVDLAATVRLRPATSLYRVRQGDAAVEAASAAALARQPEGALAGTIAQALDLPPFTADLASDSPRGGGLGASSALAVAFIAAAEEAFDLPRSSAPARAHLARDLEARLMELPTGIQDHYPALLGGALEIEQRPGGERVRALPVDLERLADSLLVAYSGLSHFSAAHNWHVVRRRLDGEAAVTALFAGIAAAASEMVPALEAGELDRVGALMSREWACRRELAPGVSTPALETLLSAALAAGAWGGKACGAGGGGCLAFLCPPAARQVVARELEAAGATLLAVRPVGEPLQVELED
jgi:D-glycero-alpha-D-manno-heptose-7-phosphate kinase